jgi:RimJ/RimL family protein N-acetyltransferase
LIREILRHPRLYDACADDFAPARENFVPREDLESIYLLVKDGGEVLGLFALAPMNQVCYEIHTRILPAGWGKRAKEAALAVIPWVWANTSARRLTTCVPSYNRLAIRFAERAGMTRYGVNPRSWQKGGELFDQVLLGISK